ncbi:hypothetical protein [Xenorhabdus indica]|uniref:hypothetical protein n=1 Tax=Xenorhabdus indica TaxID=333964 RepID=UPI001656B405|nr:hypothetical protein [Xenorhabdus indica]MBC8944768.1 hypothetical protein [Xenorhabdus indica]
MSEAIVTDGDILQFEPNFGNRQVDIPGPIKIKGTGHAKINGRKVCVLGDESSVRVTAKYTTPIYTIPGTGTITISALDASQQAPNCTSNGPLILKGKKFTAKFEPSESAKTNNSNIQPPTDILTPSSSTGSFNTQQNFATVN